MIKIGRLEITSGFMLMASIFYFFDRLGIIWLVFFAALIHELGHFIAIWMLGGRVRRIRLSLVGVCMDYDGRKIGYPGEIGIALSGPVFSFALAYGMSLLGRSFGYEWAYVLAGLSLGACLFNLLPIYQLDGGRALFFLLAWRRNYALAERVICMISCAVIFVLLAFGTWVLISTGWNFTLLAIALWLLIRYCKSGQNKIQYVL